MKLAYEEDLARLYWGDCRDLSDLPDESVHCVVTSPPYWGLRDYGLPPTVWGGWEDCEHEWGKEIKPGRKDSCRAEMEWTTGGPPGAKVLSQEPSQGSFCSLCDAWRGSLGLEPTPELYVQHIVEVFREVKRVLRRDGTVWLNMGDSYTSGGRKTRDPGQSIVRPALENWTAGRAENPPGLKDKDLIGIPWRVAFALQADGWWLRSDIIWSKPNPMPESVRDRPTKSHEYVFLLTKSARYFYDQAAIREPHSRNWSQEAWTNQRNYGTKESSMGVEHGGNKTIAQTYNPAGRNKRTVWEIPTAPYPEAHFATFPPALVEPCILAGTSEKGCCVECGAPWERVLERTGRLIGEDRGGDYQGRDKPSLVAGQKTLAGGIRYQPGSHYEVEDRGWQPTCDHEAKAVPCTVLDPFVGSGTAVYVARKLGRLGIGVDLKEEYLELARRRLTKEVTVEIEDTGETIKQEKLF